MTEKPKSVSDALGLPTPGQSRPQSTPPRTTPPRTTTPGMSVPTGPMVPQSRPSTPPAPVLRVTSTGNRPYATGLPFGATVPSSPLTNRYVNRAQNAAIPDRSRGTFAGMVPVQLGPGVGYVPNYYDEDSKWGAWRTLDKAQRNRLEKVMDRVYPGGWEESWIKNIWNSGVMASDEWAGQGRAMTPLDALEYGVKSGEIETGGGSNSNGGGGGGGGGGGTSAWRNVTYTLTDPETAERYVNASLKTFLGRQASGKEREAFLKALNAYERKNPTINEGSTVAGGGTSMTTQKNTGGTDTTQFAEDWALAQEGSAEYQAATKYFDAFMGSLENPMDVI